jgi:hypothetical protein
MASFSGTTTTANRPTITISELNLKSGCDTHAIVEYSLCGESVHCSVS